jgi:dihydroorotate dehydrogenase (NAD+) catalytic subunit
MGGVLTGRDAVEMMMAGATAVGVGSAFWYRGPETSNLILDEMTEFLQEKDIKNVTAIIGQAVRK